MASSQLLKRCYPSLITFSILLLFRKQAEERSAYWQVRFALLVYKGKQWEDSGTTTRYSTMVNHPELDAMAVFIASTYIYRTIAITVY